MNNFSRKTYDNSYLFNKEANIHHKVLTDFIINADRIDKRSDAFRGIIEDVKRMQNSSVLYTVLMMENVHLCIAKNQGLSRAFKVFEAKDIVGDRQPAIFIDVTGLISYKDGYFTCKKIDWLITYLFSALGYLLYSKSTMKLVGNSVVSLAGTECFVSLFTYIIDYLRIIGFAQNKEKISYLAGLYFLNHMMGKDIDNYTKNLAAKVAGLSTAEIKAYDLYYNEERDFVNIETFISLIANTFKLKGFTLETFIHRWNYSFGNGTYYATELLTSFMTLISSAYCGSYVVNQKQIERCCGTSMVKFCNTLLQIGVDEFDNRMYMGESELDNLVARDKNTEALKESFLKRNKLPENCKFEDKDFASKSKVKEKMENIIKYYKSTNQEDKISAKVKITAFGIVGAMSDYINKGSDDIYTDGVLEVVLKVGKQYLNEKDKRILNKELRESSEGFLYLVEKSKENKEDKEKQKRISKCVVELRKCLAYV